MLGSAKGSVTINAEPGVVKAIKSAQSAQESARLVQENASKTLEESKKILASLASRDADVVARTKALDARESAIAEREKVHATLQLKLERAQHAHTEAVTEHLHAVANLDAKALVHEQRVKELASREAELRSRVAKIEQHETIAQRAYVEANEHLESVRNRVAAFQATLNAPSK